MSIQIIKEFFEDLVDDEYLYSGNISRERALIVVFCGYIYPCLIYCRSFSHPDYSAKTVPCYSSNDVVKFIEKYGTKKDMKTLRTVILPHYKYNRKRGKFKSKSPLQTLDNIFKYSGHQHDRLVEWHCNSGCPIFIVEPRSSYNERIVYNPVLKNIGFYKVHDVNQTYQNLAMFISGIMGGSAPPMIEISDIIRLEKHGFDKKLSFRKQSNKK